MGSGYEPEETGSGWDPDMNEDGPGENQKIGHNCKYVLGKPIEAIFVNSSKVI